MQNLHLTFDHSTHSQKLGEDFTRFCGLLRIYELYEYTYINAVVGRMLSSAKPLISPQLWSCRELSWWNLYFYHSVNFLLFIKFRFFEKATKIWKKNSHLFWGYWVNVKTIGRFFQILWPSHNLLTLPIGVWSLTSEIFKYLMIGIKFWRILLHTITNLAHFIKPKFVSFKSMF